MDLHPPEQPIRSLKDFALHLCVVTVGILIALGLEQIVEAHHRASVAREAVEGFRRELIDNRELVKSVLDAMPEMRLYAASWDTAIAAQALGDLSYDTVKKYSQAYTNLRLFSDEERIMLSAWHDLQGFGEDLSALTPEQRRALVGQLHRYDSFTFSLDSAGEGVLKAAEEALR